MKSKILPVIYILCGVLIQAQIVDNYDFEKLVTFNSGNQEGMLGYVEGAAGIPSNPTTFTISENGTVYVCDTINFRINVYDLNFSYIKTIKEKGGGSIYRAYKIKVDEYENIVYYDHFDGLVKINSHGKKVFQIKPELLPGEVSYGYNYFLVKDEVIYNDPGNRNVLMIIDKDGNLLEGTTVKNRAETYRDKNSNAVINDQEILIKENKILIGNFDKHREIFEKLKDEMILTKSGNKEIKDEMGSLPYLVEKSLIGFDKDGNSYWKCLLKKGKIITVLSKNGEALATFNIQAMGNSRIAISPDGDVYFMKKVIDKKAMEFYKAERQW